MTFLPDIEHIVDRSFATSPDGSRLFFAGGMFSRPFLVPDSDTEQAIRGKLLRFLRVLSPVTGVVALALAGVFYAYRESLLRPLPLAVAFVALVATACLAGRFALATELRGLDRAPRRFMR